jgi:uncharacterized protein YjbJ (UPF0337 family)
MSGEKDQITGRVKQAAGDLTDDEELKNEGEVDEASGDLKDKIGDVSDKINEGVDNVKDKFNN